MTNWDLVYKWKTAAGNRMEQQVRCMEIERELAEERAKLAPLIEAEKAAEMAVLSPPTAPVPPPAEPPVWDAIEGSVEVPK